MTVTYRFEEVWMRREVKTFCPSCKKKSKRVLRRSYCVNGLHNEQETRAKYTVELAAKAEDAEKNGMVCRNCEAKAKDAKRQAQIAEFYRLNPNIADRGRR